ncbi:asparaginase [Kineococcus sp. SYSU DK003]|uniref:asparaginase n=1 Tax=Kineococcus sp. SYSU DK003 TaxID=3383124 RepID=UPI003D7EC7B9
MPQPENDTAPHVAVLLTGGTIGSGGDDELDRLDYVDLAHVLTDEEAVPLYRFPPGVEVGVRRFSRIRSNDVDEPFWFRLRARILQILEEEPAPSGIVVAHGTATLEETAYVLHLTVPTQVPIVVTGAQRPPTSIASDAQTNLWNAVVLAASPHARGQGVLVSLDERILSARDVVKSSNHALDTFQARDHGPLGDIDPYGNVFLERRVLRRHTTTSLFGALFDHVTPPLPRVEIVPLWAGVGPEVIDRPIASGAQGLVLASMPPGMSPSTVEAAVDAAIADGVVVVQGSRAVTGRLAHRRGLEQRGLLSTGTLSLPTARILLSLCLAAGLDRNAIADVFATH